LALAQSIPPATETRIANLETAVKSAKSAGDNAWMLTSAALVLMMTGPGLALFYGRLGPAQKCAPAYDAQLYSYGRCDGPLGHPIVWLLAKDRR
jgi:hypothetical protein